MGQKLFICQYCGQRMQAPRLMGLELTEEKAFACSTKLVDITAGKPYGQAVIAVKWSMDLTCYPIIGCNAHRFRIEVYNVAGVKMGEWYVDGNLREYNVRLEPGWVVTEGWKVKFTVEERVLVWFNCNTRTVAVKMLSPGEQPEDPQKGIEPFNWTPWLVGGGIAVAGIIGTGYLIRSVRR